MLTMYYYLLLMIFNHYLLPAAFSHVLSVVRAGDHKVAWRYLNLATWLLFIVTLHFSG